MNRRQFLQSLAAIGTAIAFPIDLANASTQEIDAAWAAAKLGPIVFTVASFGTLSFGEYVEPATRAEMYDIASDWSSREDLAYVVQCNWQLEDIAVAVMEDALKYSNSDVQPGHEVSFDSWEDWLEASSDEDFDYLGGAIRDWLETKPDVSAEYEWLPPMNHVTPESSAYCFFKGQPDELLDTLGIVFVEGDHPGSSYFGAELRNDIADANELAEEYDIPIRFVSEDDCAAIERAHHG